MERIEVTCGWKVVDEHGVAIDYIPSHTMNGRCYKDDKAFESGEGVCYIPEFAFDDDLNIEDEGGLYTRKDIIEVCDGDEQMADRIYFGLSWEYPETYYDETLDFDFEMGEGFWN